MGGVLQIKMGGGGGPAYNKYTDLKVWAAVYRFVVLVPSDLGYRMSCDAALQTDSVSGLHAVVPQQLGEFRRIYFPNGGVAELA